MADVKWIKIVVDIFDNRKIRQIEAMPEGDSILVIWFKLICLAGSTNDKGMIYFTPDIPYTEEMLATQFNRPLATVRLAMNTFQAFGMIEIVDNFLCLPSWAKYQSTDKLEQMRSKNAERQARFRAKKREELAAGNAEVTLPVTPSNALDIEEDKERDIEGDIRESTADGPPPSPPPPPDPPKPPKPAARVRSQYGWVKLTDEQYHRLISEFGQHETSRAIAYVDESAQSTGNKNKWKDWNLVIRKCIREGWGQKQYYGSQPPQRRDTGFQTSNPFQEMLNEERGRR